MTADNHYVEHAFHTWINQRQESRRKSGEEWESDLYEWKSALHEVERIPIWLKRVREGNLPTEHQQCSYQSSEPILENKVICALGTDVAECPILASLYASFRDHRNVTDDDADVIGGRVCAWHIFTSKLRDKPRLDTSEGYVQDESDRMFWARTYDNLSRAYGAADDEEPAS